MLALDVVDDESFNRRLRSDAHILAGRCMVSCPTLHRVVITGVESGWGTRTVQQHISFTRDPESSSGISVSVFQPLEESTWRDM
ncbi:hypothetical protein FIBSPDRAFT_878353 [Athelia psychrophila]|uniref:Uncharacterized protein n=1 Tax=Athelia psychrophila TaxID=1759441 RepID=A0A167V3R0_9AGAM|nr:hypothetical protein FIBSPDRAFT_878353 [Fibularhizoctonia sp. CBS 109695]